MIGGADLVLDGPTKPHDADLLVRGLRSAWPNARIQRAEDPGAVPIRSFRLPLVGPVELIVYRDEASQRAWEADGATSENQDSMIHVIVSGDGVTLVVDRRDSALAEMARELLGSLRPNRIILQAA